MDAILKKIEAIATARLNLWNAMSRPFAVLAVEDAALELAELVNLKVVRESDGDVDTHRLLAAAEHELEHLWDLRRSEKTDSYVPRRPLPGITERGTLPVKSRADEFEEEEVVHGEMEEELGFMREIVHEQPKPVRRRAARVSRGPAPRLKAA